MEQIAIISDIHGNTPALEAVLNEIHKRNINKVFCLRDIINKIRYEFLQSLGNSIDIKMSGKNIRLFHASQIDVCNRVHKHDNKKNIYQCLKILNLQDTYLNLKWLVMEIYICHLLKLLEKKYYLMLVV